MAEAIASKLCTVCGVDCAGRPRVKDQQGRYMCQECFDRAKAAKQVQTAPPVRAVAAPAPVAKAPEVNLNDNSFLLDMGKSAASGKAQSCPECGRAITEGTVICIGCGYNLKSGKRLSVKVERAKKVREKSAAEEIGSSTLFCLLGAAIGGAVGAGIWAGVASTTGYEVGWIAWGVGGLTGAGCSLGARKYAGAMSGIVAAATSLAAIAAGKYIAGMMILDKLGLANLPASEWFPKTLHPLDALWAVLAVGTAWRVGTIDITQGGPD